MWNRRTGWYEGRWYVWLLISLLDRIVRALYLRVVHTQPFHANLRCQRRSEGCVGKQSITSDLSKREVWKRIVIRKFVRSSMRKLPFVSSLMRKLLLYYTILYYTMTTILWLYYTLTILYCDYTILLNDDRLYYTVFISWSCNAQRRSEIG